MNRRTIKEWITIYLQGEARLGWPGKLHLHPRDAGGHSEGENHRYALAHLSELVMEIDDDHPAAPRRTLFGTQLMAGDLYPEEMRAYVIRLYQQRQVSLGNKRNTINRNVGRLLGSQVKRGDAFFEWLVQVGAMPATLLMELRCVGNIRRGVPGVEESERILAAPTEDFKAALRCVDPQLREMMRVQYHCDMRPGELLVMKPCDIQWHPKDRDLWIYHPKKHKNLWRGMTRAIPIGSSARELICENNERIWGSPSLFTGRDMPRLDDPNDIRFLWADENSEQPRFSTVQNYTKAIKRGCERAGVPAFTANQIRKRSTTDAAQNMEAADLARELNIEQSQLAAKVAGHKNDVTTKKHYIDPDDLAAREYAKRFG